VPLIEERFTHPTIIRMVIHEYLSPLKERSIDTLLLGCTHYPLLQDMIQEELGNGVKIINPAISAARLVEQTSQRFEKHRTAKTTQTDDCFFVSDDPERFRAIGEHFFGHPLSTVTCTQSDQP
jgi:glutamate racemase